MARALLHLGLAAAIVLAPVLCCCPVGPFTSVNRPTDAERTEDLKFPTQHDALAAPARSLVKRSCCSAAEAVPNPLPSETNKPMPPAAPKECACCSARPEAAPSENQTTVSAPEPTGELLPLACAPHAAGSPEHLGQFRGLPPPGQTGVDVRYAALFERHVLRC